jgi:hypothetical protein
MTTIFCHASHNLPSICTNLTVALVEIVVSDLNWYFDSLRTVSQQQKVESLSIKCLDEINNDILQPIVITRSSVSIPCSIDYSLMRRTSNSHGIYRESPRIPSSYSGCTIEDVPDKRVTI